MAQLPPNANLWGLNPQTGQLYNTAERRSAMDARGTMSRHIGGPLPDPRWDEWFDRVNAASSGLPEGYRASVVGNQLDPSVKGLNDALINQAAGRRTTGATMGGMPPSIADDPRSTFNTTQSGPRPWGTGDNPQAMQGLQAARPVPRTPQMMTPAEHAISKIAPAKRRPY